MLVQPVSGDQPHCAAASGANSAEAARSERQAMKRGDIESTKYELCWRYVRITYDGADIFEMDPFRVVVGGNDQTLESRRALLLE